MVLALIVILTKLEFCFQLSAFRLIRPVGVHSAEHPVVTIFIINAVFVFLTADANFLLAVNGPALKALLTGSSWVQILRKS